VASSPPPARKDLASTAFILTALGFCTGGLLNVAALVVGFLALVQAVRHPAASSGKGRAIAVIALNLGVLGLAAIAIPSLLRAKLSALEATAVGDLRTMVAAQAAYSHYNGGFFESRLACLVEPATCLPDYPKDGRPLLDPVLASLAAKAGYRRAFYPGPAGAPRTPVHGRSPAPGVVGYAFTAIPEAYEGMRAFCADSTGRMCFTPDGREPGVTPEGMCDLSTCRRYQ
jgi:hypothetical protein